MQNKEQVKTIAKGVAYGMITYEIIAWGFKTVVNLIAGV